ncbi:MAG: hypothetical protein QM770_22500 [Tepidisphaeraceae bacterium]
MWWAGVALLLASIYVRPSALPWAIVIGSASLLIPPTDRPRKFPAVTTLVLLTVLTLLPWAIRNRGVVGAWVWTTTNDGFTLYDGLNPDATGASDQTWTKSLPVLARLNEVERSRYLSELAWDWAREHPTRVAELALAKLGRLWSPVPLSAEYGSKRLYVIAAGTHAVPLMLLALVALLPGGLPGRAKFYLLAPMLLLSAMHAVSVGSLRYRVPIHVPLAVLATSALVKVPTRDSGVEHDDEFKESDEIEG